MKSPIRWIVAAVGVVVAAVLLPWPEGASRSGVAPGAGEGLRVAQAEDDPSAEHATCEGCHAQETPGIVEHWRSSTHAQYDCGCIECHEAKPGDIDGWIHHGKRIATVVTPKDCGRCHEKVLAEFEGSQHAKGGNTLHSLDNLLAEAVEGHRGEIEIPDPHNPGHTVRVNGLSFANTGCQQCHGSQLALRTKDGGAVTPWRLERAAGEGKAAIEYDPGLLDGDALARGPEGQPLYDARTWPNTGIGRMNLDGSRGSCSACHSRHDFSARRARQPENCGRCHLGPDHPQKEIYEESKHGIAYRDLKERMNLGARKWVLGRDYSAAPTCATCHMSATRTQPITHDPRSRISWSNRPAVSVRLDTNANHEVVASTGESPVVSTWRDKRAAMKDVCGNCHAGAYVDGFYQQYDDFVELYNAKYGRPGTALMDALKRNGVITKADFDEKLEWSWFYVWHHAGRRARHGVSMMAPDYAHWQGTFEVADRWYNDLIPEIVQAIEKAKADPARRAGAERVAALLREILSREEHRYAAARFLEEQK